MSVKHDGEKEDGVPTRFEANSWLRFVSVYEKNEGRVPEAIASKLVACVLSEEFKKSQPRTWARIAMKLAEMMFQEHKLETSQGATGDGHVVQVVAEFGPPKEEELNGPPNSE